MKKSITSYREKIITFGLYLGYDKAGTSLKSQIVEHCKTLGMKPSAWIRQLIQESLSKSVDNQQDPK